MQPGKAAAPEQDAEGRGQHQRAAHDRAQLERAVAAFAQAGRELGLIKGDAR